MHQPVCQQIIVEYIEEKLLRQEKNQGRDLAAAKNVTIFT
jgi:hypothetical protein